MELKYGSVCSGIEAATQAWHSLGWIPVWFSEIEPFPCKVLQHHYPQVPNLGDMTKLNQHEIYNNEPIDLLVGGTPCQSFSIAGLRGGMDDERGNLALEYCRILIAKQPKWFLWENVPGVFSSFSNEEESKVCSGDTAGQYDITETADFATLLTAFSECGYSVAWRVLDAQYFGVPQRRRRVFVVGHLGNDWRPPYAVLFERDSLRRDFEKSAKERKGTAGKVEGNTDDSGWPKTTAPTIDRSFARLQGQDNQHIDGGAGLFVEVFNEQGDAMYGTQDIGSTLSKRCNKEATDLVVQAFGAQNSHHQTMSVSNVCPTLDKSKTPAILNSVARRLTPLECERLQGFPDNYTNIPGAKDLPRYASIGNSMAVPVMHWIGARIDKVEKILQQLKLKAA